MIPKCKGSKPPHTRFASLLYKGRVRIEQAVRKLKRFSRIGLRCEKTRGNTASFTAPSQPSCPVKSARMAWSFSKSSVIERMV